MTRLRDSVSIERPAEEAEGALRRFLASLRGSDDFARLHLRVLDRDVYVEARRERGEGDLDGRTSIEWWPEGPTVFPRFSGTMLIAGDENPRCSYLELDGIYAPPIGPAGQTFDAAIGHRIAQATAHELLAGIKAAIERRS